MNHAAIETHSYTDSDLKKYVIKGLVRFVLGLVILASVLFLSAGTREWLNGWVYLGVVAVTQLSTLLILLKFNPELFIERSRGLKPDTKGFDRTFFKLFIPLMFIAPAICGLDAMRFGWQPLPGWSLYLGLLIYIPLVFFSLWALMVNRHFEATVRIQKDRDHRVISDGPYRLVRHPGYVAGIGAGITLPLILGSAWGFAPGLLIVILFVVRTKLEDRTLHEELPGYREYAQKTRYRLLPYIW